MLIRELLRRKGSFVATVTPDTSIVDLLSLLGEHNVGALVVSYDGKTVEGIVSERDVVRAMRTAGATLLSTTVGEIMTADVFVAAPGDSVDAMMRMMTDQHIRHVPIVVDGELNGIISIGDVVKNRIDELETEREHLIGYISQGG